MRLTSFLLVLVVLLCSGCSSPPSTLQKFFSLHKEPSPAVFNSGQLQKQLEERLAAKDPLAALVLIGSAIHQGENESTFSRYYPTALNAVLIQAQGLRSDDQPLSAGTLFRAARFNYPLTAALTSQAAMTLTEIDACIELCANRLLERGLYAYRQGRLEEAIATWSEIERFHPEHTASLRAITTTRIQLDSLQHIKP